MAYSISRQADTGSCDCSYSLGHFCMFEADPDIAGIGVLLSFIISACIAYAIVLAAYYFVQPGYDEGIINRLDSTVARAAHHLVTYITRPLLQKSAIVRKLDRISTAIADSNLLYKILLAFTDQQLVTGLAILIAGYRQVETITEYHFAIVQNMATLSFTIHSATASLLEDTVLQNPAMKNWRGIAIISFQIMTLVTYLPLGHEYWMESYGMPTICLWRNMSGHYDPTTWLFWSMVVYMFLILLGIARTLYAYFPRAWSWIFENKAVDTTRIILIEVILLPRRAYAKSASQSKTSLMQNVLCWFFWSLATLVFVLAEILWSEAFSLLRRWTMIVNNIYYTFYLRSTAVANGREDDEDAWGFGQAVPMFLLIIPLALIMETSYDAYKERFRLVDRWPRAQNDQRLSASTAQPVETSNTTHAKYAVVWDSRVQPGSTCWISSVEITSSSASLPDDTQTFSPGSVEVGYARVSLETSGKRVCHSGATYYFDYEEAVDDWDLENNFYKSLAFRTVMLGLLLASFAAMTILGLYL